MSNRSTDGRGALIKSVVNETTETVLHIGPTNNSFVRSLMKALPDADMWVAESDDDMKGAVELVGRVIDSGEYIYDMVAIPAGIDVFSTAMYVALESALVEGGLVVVYGNEIEMHARHNLLVEMIKEGVMSPFSWGSYTQREMMIFVLADGILVRSM